MKRTTKDHTLKEMEKGTKYDYRQSHFIQRNDTLET